MVSAGPIRAKRERCQPFQDGSPLEGITGADAGDAGPDGALSRPPLARRGGQSRLHLPSGRASIRPWDG